MAAAPNTTAPFNDAENRIVGMMVGSAVADAIGIYTHDLTKSEVTTAYGRRRIVASYKANELTPHVADDYRAQYDDGNYSEVTEMALCSLLSHVNDADPKELPRRLRQLSLEGNRATGRPAVNLGQPTKDIVESPDYLPNVQDATPVQVGAAATAAAMQRWISQARGAQDRNGSNASLVRIHPVAADEIKKIVFSHRFGADKEPEPVAIRQNMNWSIPQAVENCRFTHVDAICNFAAMVAVTLLRGLIRGEVHTQAQITPLIQKCKSHVDYWGRDFAAKVGADRLGAYYTVPEKEKLSRLLTVKSLAELELDSAEDRGDVRKCLGVGIFCLRTAMVRLEGAGAISAQARDDARKVVFAELIHSVVREGGAAQANAAFAGALLGAYLGYDAIPEQLRKGLSDAKFLMRKSKLLCAYLGVIDDAYVRENDSRLFPTRNASERRAIQGTIQNRRRIRRQMLHKRRGDPILLSERRRTTYGSLGFPPRPTTLC